jgi:hypothetical protein
MRVMGMVLLVLTLAGCTGDRTKQSMHPSEETQPRVASGLSHQLSARLRSAATFNFPAAA